MPRSANTAPVRIAQLKVTLRDSKPPIWRRVLVPDTFTLGDLHTAIQVAMGWTNSHLHNFTIGQNVYGMTGDDMGFEFDFGMDDIDEDSVTLREVLPAEGKKFRYEYDFGDGWEHEVLVEKILPMEGGAAYPRCIKGKRACPPENCGGIWGYMEMLETLQHPESPEYAELREWLDRDLDPEAFSEDEVNALLAQIFTPKPRRRSAKAKKDAGKAAENDPTPE
jgi:hypothetical protein